MDDNYIICCLQDILDAIEDIEKCFEGFPARFDLFVESIPLRCVVERKVEIMGEAINRIKKAAPEFQIPNGRAIIDTRNRIIHSYDNVYPEFLWGLVIRHIPNLKNDIERIMSDFGVDPDSLTKD